MEIRGGRRERISLAVLGIGLGYGIQGAYYRNLWKCVSGTCVQGSYMGYVQEIDIINSKMNYNYNKY